MNVTTITGKGQITIPKDVRRELGLAAGRRVEFKVVGDHLEMHVLAPQSPAPTSGFGLVKSPRPTVPADFDPAALLNPDADL